MESTTDRVEVLIVGAGPTGLSLALQLQRFGVRPRIVDRRPDRVQESRALAIQPRSLELLRPPGIARTLARRGNDAVGVRLHAGNRVVSIPLFDLGLDDTEYPFLLFLSQAETEEVLGEYLAGRGVRVERGVELTGFEAGEEVVACRLRRADGRTERIEASYLVGCDGAHSTVRHGAGIAFEGSAYPQTFVLADLEVKGGLEPDCVHAYTGARGTLFFFPLGHPATWRLQSMQSHSKDDEDRSRATGEPSLEALQKIVDGFTDGDLRLHDPAWRTYFRIHRRQAATYRAGRVILAGDAAHVHSPAGAQGMNTGIQDAWNLGWKLALVVRGRARAALLDSYEAERWPVGRSVLRLSDRPMRIATSARWPFRVIRTHLAPRALSLAKHFSGVRARVFRRLSQLDVRYRDSPVVQEGEPRLRSGPRAGDRLPDAPLERDGRSTSLHREFSDPGFHLLLCGPEEPRDAHPRAALSQRYGTLLEVHHLRAEARPGDLVDVRGEAFARLGVNGATRYLVRPDGHVGYRAGGNDLKQLSRYLARWLIEEP